MRLIVLITLLSGLLGAMESPNNIRLSAQEQLDLTQIFRAHGYLGPGNLCDISQNAFKDLIVSIVSQGRFTINQLLSHWCVHNYLGTIFGQDPNNIVTTAQWLMSCKFKTKLNQAFFKKLLTNPLLAEAAPEILIPFLVHLFQEPDFIRDHRPLHMLSDIRGIVLPTGRDQKFFASMVTLRRFMAYLALLNGDSIDISYSRDISLHAFITNLFYLQSPLMQAIIYNSSIYVKKLLATPEGKALMHQPLIYGTTPLWWACILGRDEIAQLLLMHDSDPKLLDDWGYSISPKVTALVEHAHLAPEELDLTPVQLMVLAATITIAPK